MSWKDILKLDRAKLKRERRKRRKNIDALIQLPEEDREEMRSALGRDINALEMSNKDAIREKRKKSGLSMNRTPRSKRIHRMKPEDRPKPMERAKPKKENPFFLARRGNPSNEAFAEFDEEQRERGNI